MRMKKTGTYFLMAFFLIAFAAGCASTASKPYQHSGFLSDYSRLHPSGKDKEAEIYIDPAVDFKQYDKILLERIRVYYKDDAENKEIDPTQLKMLTDYFYHAIERELADAYPIVTEPGPGVLRVRIAITELVPAKPAISVVVLVTPYATVADLASGVVSGKGAGSPPYLGHTAIEGEILDSQRTMQLVAYVERRVPKKYNLDTIEGAGGAVKKYADSYFKSYTEWGYTKQACDYWAKGLRALLDEVHGVKPVQKNESLRPEE